MARLLLSDADDWHLKFPDDQDVRGFRVLDAQRADTGLTIRDMVIDTDQEVVSHVVFSDGAEFPAGDLSIGDGVVYATTDLMDDARRTSDIEGYGRVGRRSDAEAYNDPLAAGSLIGDDPASGSAGGSSGGAMSSGDTDDDAAYQAHFGTTYGRTGQPFDTYRPAYDYGREVCAQHGNRDFAEVEMLVRGDYEGRYGRDGDSAWDNVKGAVRHAYDRARQTVR